VKSWRALTLLAAAALSASCSSHRPAVAMAGREWDGSLPSSYALPTSAARPFRPAVVLPVPSMQPDDRAGVPLSALSGHEAALEDLLLSLFAGSELNILVGDDVRRSMSFDVKDTTMEGAFVSLLGHLDLAWRVQGNYVVVEQHEQRTWSVVLPAVASDDGTGALDVQARLWDELTDEVSMLLGSRGQVMARPAAGTLEVVAPPALLNLVADQVDAFQRTLLRLVTISARLLEVELPDGVSDLDWQALAAALGRPAPPRDGALDLGIPGVEALLAALAKQGQLRAGPALTATTRNGSPARLHLPDARGDVLELRLLPRAGEDGSIDLSLEREAGGAGERRRMASARSSVSSGRMLALAGPVTSVSVETSASSFGGIFSTTTSVQRRVASVLLVEPSVGESGLTLGAVPAARRDATQLLQRRPPAVSEQGKTAISRAGLSSALHAAGCQALSDGHDRQALALFGRASELDPSRPDPWLHAAAIELRTGRPHEARRLAARALSIDPADVLALTLVGLADLAERRLGEAHKQLARAYAARPCAVTATNLAAALLEAGDLAQARMVLSEQHPLESELFEPHLDRAYIHLSDGELSAARTELLLAANLGAPLADQRMMTLEAMAHALRLELGDEAAIDVRKLPSGLEDLVDPSRSPDHFLSGWH